MSVKITETDHNTILVNNKELYRDANGNWVSNLELTAPELIAFNDYILSPTMAKVLVDQIRKDLQNDAIKDNTFKLLNEVMQERQRQDEKWGVQNHSPFVWLAILGEEVGEANKAAVDAHFMHKVPNYGEYRAELIQVAAVAVAMVESLDRTPDPLLDYNNEIDKLGALYEDAKDLACLTDDHPSILGSLLEKLRDIRTIAATALKRAHKL